MTPRHDTQDTRSAQRCWRFTTPAEAKGQRLDRFLGEALQQEGLSREKIKTWIKTGKLLRDGAVCRKPNTLLGGGELLELQGETPDSSLTPESGELHILYEDAHCAVLDKPAGLTVHPAPGLEHGTLAHRLLHRYPELAEMNSERPGIVHRIDKDTSGLLLVARTESARLALAEAFAARRVEKHYLALVQGLPRKPHDSIDAPIGRHPTQKVKMAVHRGGRPARSDYLVLHVSEDQSWSLLAVRIHTGRTHQIRVHLRHIGHPILGDPLYGPGTAACPPRCRPEIFARLARRQMLHAWKLAFSHPASGERLEFLCPPPPDFPRLALYLSRRLQRVAVTGLPGCGKSALCGLLREAGAPLFSADTAVAALYEPGEDGWTFLRNRFGEAFMTTDARGAAADVVDKKKLFAAMQRDNALRREVEAAVHPMVRHRLESFWQGEARQRMAVAEIPLLLEAGEAWRRQAADLLVSVYRPRASRLERLAASRGWSEETLAAMEAWQWSEAAKLNACDLIVDNSGDLETLKRRGQGLLRVLRWLRARRMKLLAKRLQTLWGCS